MDTEEIVDPVEPVEEPVTDPVDPVEEPVADPAEPVEPVEEPVKEPEETVEDPEETEEPVEEPEVNLDDLLKDISDKDKQLETVKAEYEAGKKQAKALNKEVERLNGVIGGLVEERVKAIPEEFRDLLPAGDVVEQLAWLNKAEAKGLFTKTQAPEVEIGRPLKVTTGTAQTGVALSSTEKMSNAFSKVFAKR